MDKRLKFCEENDIDTASVSLINKSLKEKDTIRSREVKLG